MPGIDADNSHPNLKGNGEIAQEFFMKMAYSPKYMERQSIILKGQDQIYNKAIESEFLKQVGESEMSSAAPLQ